MPLGIPKVPLFYREETEEEKKKAKERRKRLPGYFQLHKEDIESDNKRGLESDNERDRESDYESDRAYSELISRLEHDQDGGAEAKVEEDKDKDKEKEKEKRKKQAIPYVDLYMRMYLERILFCFGELTEFKGWVLTSMIDFTNRKTIDYTTGKRKKVPISKKDILFLINSPGGDLGTGIALYNTMGGVPSVINTLCVGSAFSIACFLLAVGEEKRTASANSRIMLHEPYVTLGSKPGWEDFYSDQVLIKKLTHFVVQELAQRTGKSEQTIKKDLKSDKFMSAEEAQIHGIIDCIVDEKNYKDLLRKFQRSKRGFQKNT